MSVNSAIRTTLVDTALERENIFSGGRSHVGETVLEVASTGEAASRAARTARDGMSQCPPVISSAVQEGK